MPKYNRRDYTFIMKPLPKDWPKTDLGIPFIKKEPLDVSTFGYDKFLISPQNVSSKTKNLQDKIVHLFRNEQELQRILKDPLKFLDKISGCYGICSPDISLHEGMEKWQIIQAVGNSRWFGAYCQSLGIRVYPIVGWLGKDTYDICFSGLEDGSVFFISNLGTNNPECRQVFLNGLYELRRRYPNSRQICVGTRMEGIPSDVCIVPYPETFGDQDQYTDGFQSRLFTWDGTLIKEDK